MQIRSNDITAILDVCLERMRGGESLEDCVHDYPAEADELEPLLIAAMYARSTFTPPSLSPQARQAIQRKLHQAVAARQPAPQPTRVRWFGTLAVRFALALVVALLGLGTGVAAAQSSLPGSALYPLKRASESVRLRFASSPAQRAMLHLDFAAARSAEIQALVNGEQPAVDDSLVDDLDQEYQLAWEEIGQAPANQVPDLVGRYVIERRADVRVFSSTLAHASAAARGQIQRAVRLGEQALAIVDPAKRDVNTDGNDDGNDPSNPVDKPDTVGPKVTPKATPEGKPDAAQATPEGKPDTAGPKATPEGKPDTAGPKATPEGKPDTAGPKATPEDKPDNTGPKATPEDKPDTAGPKATPEPKPDTAGPKATPEGKPQSQPDAASPQATPEGKPESQPDAATQATPEGKPETAGPQATPEDNSNNKPDDKPDNAGPKPKPKPGHGKP